MRRKRNLLSDQISERKGIAVNDIVVHEARDWAMKMVRWDARASGDLSGAMARVARRCGVTRSLIWALHYRPPKDIWTSAYFKLHEAYRAECERQAKLFDHEFKIAAAKAGPGAPFVRAAVVVAGEGLGGSAAPDAPLG